MKTGGGEERRQGAKWFIALAALLATCISCSRRSGIDNALYGQYVHAGNPQTCKLLANDRITIRPDHTFEQRVVWKNSPEGKRLQDAEARHDPQYWKILDAAKGSSGAWNRVDRNHITLTGWTNVRDESGQSNAGKSTVVLEVHPEHPVVLVERDTGCFYTQPK
jgi:hypothetical protein